MKVIQASLFLSYSAAVSGFASLPQSNYFAARQQCAAPLHMSGDRAHTEKMLEDMMGDDWRTVRAKLIAQEQIESHELKEDIRQAHRAMHQRYSGSTSFAQSAFDTPHNAYDRQREGEHFGHPQHSRQQSLGPMDKPKIPQSTQRACNDPFANPEDIPALVEPRVNIDSKHWAHQIPNIETGCVLVATDRLGGQFKQTIMLVVDHDPTGQASSTGLVINRPLECTLAEISSNNSPELRGDLNNGLKSIFDDARVAYGGPVMPDDYTILHSWGEVDGSKKVSPGVFVGGSTELAYEASRRKFDPREALFIKGHEVFAPNQLQHEIDNGVWYIASASSDFILRFANEGLEEGYNPNDMWYEILLAMGGQFAQIAWDYDARAMEQMPEWSP